MLFTGSRAVGRDCAITDALSFRQWLVACWSASHYLNQWWLFVYGTFRKQHQWNLNSKYDDFYTTKCILQNVSHLSQMYLLHYFVECMLWNDLICECLICILVQLKNYALCLHFVMDMVTHILQSNFTNTGSVIQYSALVKQHRRIWVNRSYCCTKIWQCKLKKLMCTHGFAFESSFLITLLTWNNNFVNMTEERKKMTTSLYFWQYRKTSCISRTKFQNLNVSRFVLQLPLPNPLKLGVRSSMKM